MRSLSFLAIAVLTLSSLPARAERTLTLDEVLQLARRGSRDLQAARARVDQAATNIEQARVPLLPQVSAQGKYTHNYREVTLDLSSSTNALVGLASAVKAGGIPSQNAAMDAFIDAAKSTVVPSPVIQKQDQLDAALNVAVPLLVPWAYPGLTAARQTAEAAEATRQGTEADTLLRAAQAFYAAAGNNEVVRARREAVDVAKKTLEDAKVRVEVGVLNRVEVTRAQAALERAEQAAAEAEDLRAQAYRALATQLALDDEEPLRVAPPELPTGEAASAGELLAGALRSRPELRAAELQVRAAEATASSNKWKWAPTVSAFGNLRAFNYAGFSGDQYAWALGGQIDLTIYDGGARDAARHLAEAQQREGEARLSLLRDTVRDDIVNARRTLGTKRRGLDAARRGVQLASESLELIRAQYAAGTAKQLDLLTAQDQLVAAELSLAQARFDLALADLTLKRAAGLFDAASSPTK